jgi:DNA-binding NarL/FixJ family response regulator
MNPDADLIRVLIVDDHPVVRRGMGALLASLPGVEVVGEAATGAEALREAQLQRPNVVMMDVQMPSMDGIEATRRLATALPDTAVLVLTMFEDDDTVFSAMRAGARGYLLKGAEQDEILAALHSVIAGQVVIGPGVAERLIGGLGSTTDKEVSFPELHITITDHAILTHITTL